MIDLQKKYERKRNNKDEAKKSLLLNVNTIYQDEKQTV